MEKELKGSGGNAEQQEKPDEIEESAGKGADVTIPGDDQAADVSVGGSNGNGSDDIPENTPASKS